MIYVTEVSEFFMARYPGATMLSSADYKLIAEWEKQGIPLALVLRSINEVYYDFEKEGIEIESINECQAWIESNFNEWLKSQAVGKTNLR